MAQGRNKESFQKLIGMLVLSHMRYVAQKHKTPERPFMLHLFIKYAP
jgi:hypothetical protein